MSTRRTITRRLLSAAAGIALFVTPTVAAVGVTATAAHAATAGTWTGWTLNPQTGCKTAAQVPHISNGWVAASVAVWCPRDTWLSVRGRVRSDRTLTDVTVGNGGCGANGTCPVIEPAGTRYYNMYNNLSHCPGQHGYHSDVIIYPGTNSFATTGSTSGSATLSPACYA